MNKCFFWLEKQKKKVMGTAFCWGMFINLIANCIKHDIFNPV